MPNVELPNGQIAEFPDDMPTENIKAFIQKKFPSLNTSNIQSQSNQPNLLQRAGNFVEQNVNQPIEQNILNPLNSISAGFEQGLANIAPGLGNLAISGINKIIPQKNQISKIPMFNFAPNNAAATAGEIGSFFVGPGGVFKAVQKIPEAASFINSVSKMPYIAHMLSKSHDVIKSYPMTSKIAGNAILGGAYSPNNQLTGMALGGAAPIVGNAISKVYEKLRPSNILRGNLTPEELKNNLNITQGTESGLGDVLGNPMLKRLHENILSKIPFSGVNEGMQRTANTIVQRGNNLLTNLLGKNNPENIELDLNNALKEQFNKQQKLKNAIYEHSNKIADDMGLQLPMENFSSQAKKYYDAFKNTNILQHEPEIKSIMSKLFNYKEPGIETTNIGKIVDKQGNPIINESNISYPSLKEANILKGKFNKLSQDYARSSNPSDRNLSSIFGNLASAAKKDIQSSIQKSGNKELSNAYNLAETNYAKNFSPFLDNEIYKYLGGKSDPETLVSSFIKTGKSTDRANLINKLVSKLPENKKNLLGYAYLQRALDENNTLNPFKLKTLLSRNAIGPRQLKALFPDKEIRNELNNLVDLTGKNTKALKLMQNPETGQMNMDILPLISRGPTTLGAKMIGARPITNALTSEKIRDNLVRQMISNSMNK